MSDFKLDAESFEDRRAAGQNRNVFHHRLAAIAVTRSLDCSTLEGAAEPVDDQRRQGFAVDVFGDDQQRLALLNDCFQQRNQVLDVGDLLLEDQHVGIFENALPSTVGSVTK